MNYIIVVKLKTFLHWLASQNILTHSSYWRHCTNTKQAQNLMAVRIVYKIVTSITNWICILNGTISLQWLNNLIEMFKIKCKKSMIDCVGLWLWGWRHVEDASQSLKQILTWMRLPFSDKHTHTHTSLWCWELGQSSTATVLVQNNLAYL